MSEDNKKDKVKIPFMKKYGQLIHMSLVAILICGIMIYIMVNGG